MVSLTASTIHAAELVMGGDNIYGATPDEFNTYLEFDSAGGAVSSDKWTGKY